MIAFDGPERGRLAVEFVPDALVATSVLHVVDGDEVVTVLSIEPPAASFRLGMRVGARVPLAGAAHGITILAARKPSSSDGSEIVEARERGYAVTSGAVAPGFTGIFAAITVAGEPSASVGLVMPDARMDEVPVLAAEVVSLAEALSLTMN